MLLMWSAPDKTNFRENVLDLKEMRSTYSIRGVQPMAGELHAAQDGYEYGPTGNYKFT